MGAFFLGNLITLSFEGPYDWKSLKYLEFSILLITHFGIIPPSPSINQKKKTLDQALVYMIIFMEEGLLSRDK